MQTPVFTDYGYGLFHGCLFMLLGFPLLIWLLYNMIRLIAKFIIKITR